MKLTPTKIFLFFSLLLTSLICCIACNDPYDDSTAFFGISWPTSANTYHANTTFTVKPHRFPFEQFSNTCGDECNSSAIQIYGRGDTDTAELGADGDLYDVDVVDENGVRIELFQGIVSIGSGSSVSLELPHPPGGIQPPILDGGLDAGLDGGAP